jgi:hypothetical protein
MDAVECVTSVIIHHIQHAHGTLFAMMTEMQRILLMKLASIGLSLKLFSFRTAARRMVVALRLS